MITREITVHCDHRTNDENDCWRGLQVFDTDCRGLPSLARRLAKSLGWRHTSDDADLCPDHA